MKLTIIEQVRSNIFTFPLSTCSIEVQFVFHQSYCIVPFYVSVAALINGARGNNLILFD